MNAQFALLTYLSSESQQAEARECRVSGLGLRSWTQGLDVAVGYIWESWPWIVRMKRWWLYALDDHDHDHND